MTDYGTRQRDRRPRAPRPADVPLSDDACVCGHREDDHDDSWVAPCVVAGCRCVAFDPAPEP